MCFQNLVTCFHDLYNEVEMKNMVSQLTDTKWVTILICGSYHYCITLVFANHWVAHMFWYLGLFKCIVFFCVETLILEMTLGFMPQSYKWDFISTNIGFLCNITLLF